MQSFSLALLYAIPPFLNVLFYVAVLIVLFAKRSACPPAARLAILGVSMLLVMQVFSWGLYIFVVPQLEVEAIPFVNGIINIFTCLLHLAGLSLILAAVLAHRRDASQDTTDPSFSPSRNVEASDNPYAPTSG